jgi:lipoprotein-releasing system permease protein
MFELSVACKYLIPRRRQLSVSIISLISVLVIALVVWLIVVFFSVTDGLEKSWVQKLTALTAPVRITPTDAYYHSYYYQIDSISESSNYSPKTIHEKRDGFIADPYNPEVDQEIPSFWPTPDRNQDGTLKDLVKLVYASLNDIQNVSGLQGQDFELTATHIRLHLLRNTTVLHGSNVYGGTTQSTLSYPAYLGNFESDNQHLGKTLLAIDNKDLNNLLYLIGMANDDAMEDSAHDKVLFTPDVLRRRLKNFFDFVTIQQLKSRPSGWTIPRNLFPSEGEWDVCVVLKDQHVIRLIVPLQTQERFMLQQTLEEQGLTVIQGRAMVKEGVLSLISTNQEIQIPPRLMLTLAGGSPFKAQLDKSSIERAKQVDNLLFDVEISIQGTLFKGKIPYRGVEIATAEMQTSPAGEGFPLWIHHLDQISGVTSYILPKDLDIGEGIALPKSFRDAGVMIGDRGSLSYLAPTASVLQEQQIPIYVAGFYDPGIIPIGGKFILASQEVTSLIRASHQQDDKAAITNGINVRFNRLDQAEDVKAQLQEALKQKGISRYWNIETYREYEFTKEIMRELQSQKNLFMLIAVVIILVACSNIISMLILLVNDKKLEIGILRSMGASSKSIALIFGLAGALIGVLGSTAGIVAAILTLHYLDTLVRLLSRLQGHDMFSANLYGQVLPHELSFEALSFVLIATVCISLLAGIVPAIKACLLRPSQILRAGGG